MTLERHDIQRVVFSGYPKLADATFVALRIERPDACRAWLSTLVDEVTYASVPTPRQALNVAFTHAGLEALGVADELSAAFPRAFREGMVTEHRSRILGDVGGSAPDRWSWGGPAPARRVHVLLLAYGPARSAALARSYLASAGDAVSCLAAIETRLHPRLEEPFGFRDGVSQPVIAGTRRARALSEAEARLSVVEPGEILLGYTDETGRRPASPTIHTSLDPHDILAGVVEGDDEHRDFGRNGSYLVCRLLEQDVDSFRRFIADEVRPHEGVDAHAEERLAARMVGRWRSGASLSAFPLADPAWATLTPEQSRPWAQRPAYSGDLGTGYGYAADRFGVRCPVGAHIRRANPRDSLDLDPDHALAISRRRRLLRRGRPYQRCTTDPDWLHGGGDGEGNADPGGDPPRAKGLLFVCFNADLERQFEFVQQNWINGSSFGGLRCEVDPLVGDPAVSETVTIPNDPLRRRLARTRRFVQMRGGDYFFLPGQRALQYLSRPVSS